MIDYSKENKEKFGASIKVIGVGGAGGNAVNSMIDKGNIEAVSFIVANTDAQALSKSSAPIKIQLGAKITKGLGAGSNPDIGRRSAEEEIETIISDIQDTDILFLTAGFGGGTGSGALPFIAKTAKDLGILTVAIVTKPFIFEGKRRLTIAKDAIEHLKDSVDTLIVIPNQRLLEISDAKISMLDAFALSNNILQQAIRGISEIITKSGHINVDFADVRSIMKDMGLALMGTGIAKGENRAQEAAFQAINSPLLENMSINGAKGILLNITGNSSLGLHEINEAASLIYDLVSEDANIILGSVINEDVGDDFVVTVIATGFSGEGKECIIPPISLKKIEGIKEKITIQKESTITVDKKEKNQKEMICGAVKEKEFQKTEEQKQPERKPSKKETVKIFYNKEKDVLRNAGSLGREGYESCDVDKNDLDVPTFLRKNFLSQDNFESKKIITPHETLSDESKRIIISE
jgi:cell division protein FtsZ